MFQHSAKASLRAHYSNWGAEATNFHLRPEIAVMAEQLPYLGQMVRNMDVLTCRQLEFTL
jgi:hypothetical protein